MKNYHFSILIGYIGFFLYCHFAHNIATVFGKAGKGYFAFIPKGEVFTPPAVGVHKLWWVFILMKNKTSNGGKNDFDSAKLLSFILAK